MASSLTSLLPPARERQKQRAAALDSAFDDDAIDDDDALEAAFGASKKAPPAAATARALPAPAYPHRKGWVPKTQADFGQGGAYPEIHVAQYPLGMGKKSTSSGATVPLQLDSDGKVQYDAIARQGIAQDKVVHTKLSQQLVKVLPAGDEALQRPDPSIADETAAKTRETLETIVGGRANAARPVQLAQKVAPAEYVRYTPAEQGTALASGAQQRIIRIVEEQVDPIEPPRFLTNKKVPGGPPSPPAPVMHSPPRKPTKEEHAEWTIPPCVSSWKNSKGYVIPLDKRHVNDGRGIEDATINDNFAKLAQSLYIAEKKAVEEVEARAAIQRKLAQKEKEAKEASLRALAQKAREARAGMRPLGGGASGGGGGGGGGGLLNEDPDEELDEQELRERDEIRQERRKERERTLRMQNMGNERKSKMKRDEDRDISEQVALGLPATGGARKGDDMYDQRLFGKSQGLGSGFGADDSYDVYDKPMALGARGAAAGSSIYRPSKTVSDDVYGDDVDSLIRRTDRFQADKGFRGADRAAGDTSTQARSGPVQFQMEAGTTGAETATGKGRRDGEQAPEEDLFGINKFLSDAKKGRGTGDGARDSMQYGGSNPAGLREGGGSSKRPIDFESEGSDRKRGRR